MISSSIPRAPARSAALLRVRRFLYLAVALTGSACGSADRMGSVSTAVDSSAGYPVYRHSGTPPQWRVELIATVGADTGGPYQFGEVRSVVLDSHGSLYVLQPRIAQVSVFNSSGTFVGTRGRKGKGPGEFGTPESVVMLGDSLVVFAPFSQRFVMFAPDGEWIRTWPAPRPTGEHDLLIYRTPGDGFWFSTILPPGAEFRRVFIRYPTRGTSDTVANFRPTVMGPPPITCPAGNGGFSWFEVPYGPAAYSRQIDGDEQAIVISSEYRIAIVGPEGDTLRVLERDVEPSPIADADWESEMARFRAWRAQLGNPSCTRSGFERPSARPVFEWMFVDDERRLWVETYGPDGSVYEVFDTDGSLIAAVTGLPPSRGVDPSVVNGRIALYAPDANDIPRVQVFRIVDESRAR